MSGASTSLPILLEHFENALPQTCRDMGVEIRVGTLAIGVDGPLRRAVGFASYRRKRRRRFPWGNAALL